MRSPSTRRLASAPIHLSAWKGNSQKSVCRMPYSSARWPPYGQSETSRLLQVDHYMLHLRIMMRSGTYASSRQDAHYMGCGVVRSCDPGSVTRGKACLTSVCIQGVLKVAIHGQARRVLETTSFA